MAYHSHPILHLRPYALLLYAYCILYTLGGVVSLLDRQEIILVGDRVCNYTAGVRKEYTSCLSSFQLHLRDTLRFG